MGNFITKCFYNLETGAQKKTTQTWFSVLDSCSRVQDALCARSERQREEKKECVSQWGFCCLSWRQETLTDKYLAPLCLKYLSVALDTMSTNASSVLYSSPVSLSTRFFHVFIRATVFSEQTSGCADLACVASRLPSLHSPRG